MDDFLANWETAGSAFFEAPANTPTFGESDNPFQDMDLTPAPAPPNPAASADFLGLAPPTPSQPAPPASAQAALMFAASPGVVNPVPTPQPVKPGLVKSPNPTDAVLASFMPIHTPSPPARVTTPAARRLRPKADAIVAHCWKTACSEASFIRKVRSEWSNHCRGGSGWTLDDDAEGALLDALVARLCTGDSYSQRLMSYMRYSLLSGAVRPKSVIATCLRYVHEAAERTQQGIARLFAELLPFYTFTGEGDDLTKEAQHYLDAFTVVLRCAARAPFDSELNTLMSGNRFVALVRACGRRVPAKWNQIKASFGSLPKHLTPLVTRLKLGLGGAATNYADVVKFVSIERLVIPPPDHGLPAAVPMALQVSSALFGPRVAAALGEVWLKQGKVMDLNALMLIDRELAQVPVKMALKDCVRACEATVRFLAERGSIVGSENMQWGLAWGGRERLLRIMRDAVPQLRGELRSERGCMVVAMAVIGCVPNCLGHVLRVDGEDGGSQKEAMDDDIEKHMNDLVSFAVGAMEDAAQAEETPAWRSFGLWLLLFATRCGALLRAARCEHVKAAKVLRAWSGMPTGTPGSHAGSGNRSGSEVRGSGSSSGSAAAVEAAAVLATFAAPAAHAIIDMADACGDDATMHALCADYVQ